MHKDTADIKASIDSNNSIVTSMVQQIEAQSSQLSDLCGWKPDLEARFAKLQASVADLKRAQPSAAAWSGSAARQHAAPSSFHQDGAIHGPDGHDVDNFSGGFPAGASAGTSGHGYGFTTASHGSYF